MNIRTFLLTCLLAAFCLAPASAQVGPAKERPDDLKFTIYPVKKISRSSPLELRPTSKDAVLKQAEQVEIAASGRRHESSPVETIVSLKIHARNLGEKAIKSISGQLLIIEGGSEAARLPFISKEKIGSNIEKRLATIDLKKLEPPLRDRFQADLLLGEAVARVRVERVEYEDGSVWQHP